jgi:protein TonB
LSGCALLAATSPRSESRERNLAMTEMEETDLGLDAEPESAAQAPKKVAKAAATDPEMDDLLANHALSGKPPGTPSDASEPPAQPPVEAAVETTPAPQTSSAPSAPSLPTSVAAAPPVSARARERTQEQAPPTVRAPPTVQAPVVAPLDEPRAARASVHDGLPTGADDAAPMPLPLPLPSPAPSRASTAAATPSAPLQRRQAVAAEPQDEIELAAIGGPTRSDLSRSPMLAGNGQWDCPFPSEAARAGVDSAIVMLRVEVKADSHIESVIVLRDPGDGFGREARRCALAKRWQAGLDREGKAAQRTTVVSVHFQRKG